MVRGNHQMRSAAITGVHPNKANAGMNEYLSVLPHSKEEREESFVRLVCFGTMWVRVDDAT
jgi:hypothetical protein